MLVPYHEMGVDPVGSVLCNVKFISEVVSRLNRAAAHVSLEQLNNTQFHKYVPLSNHGRAVHPACTVLEHAVGMERSRLVQAVVGVDDERVIDGDIYDGGPILRRVSTHRLE